MVWSVSALGACHPDDDLPILREADAVNEPGEYEIVLPGEPVPWAEKQENRVTGNRFFPKRQTRAVKAHLKTLAGADPLPFDAGQPLLLSAVFFCGRPAYHYGTGRNFWTLKHGYAYLRRPTGKPDLSNLVKLAEDSLVMAKLIPDDDQIVGFYKPFGKIYKHTLDAGRREDDSRTVLRLKVAR